MFSLTQRFSFYASEFKHDLYVEIIFQIHRAGTSGKMQRIVEEKDETISALMAEGEKLQKQQLTSNNLIKKLRKKEKEGEELNRDHK